MADEQPTLNSLAAKITELSASLTSYLEGKKIPAPTFAADSPASYENLDGESWMTRQKLLDTITDMLYLAQGPTDSIFNYVHTVMPDAAALNILNHFDFWSAVPISGSASYAEIAQKVSLPEDVVYRVLQHAITLRIFAETEPGKSSSRIQHTGRSAVLARSTGFQSFVATVLDGSGGPMIVLPEALQRYSKGKQELTQKAGETGFALFHSGGIFGEHTSAWELQETDGEGEKQGYRQKNYAQFMRWMMELFHLQDAVAEAIDWGAIGEGVVVDVGGSAGHDAIVLAKKFPELTITVQDLPKIKPVFEAELPAELVDRVKFMEHSFFDQQPIQADVYVLKMILHDWLDPDAIKILQALVPALKTGARVLLLEYIGSQDDMETLSLPRVIQQMGTATDLRLMALFNGKERPVSAWKEIVRKTDERFEVVNVNANPENFFAVIEVVWRG